MNRTQTILKRLKDKVLRAKYDPKKDSLNQDSDTDDVIKRINQELKVQEEAQKRALRDKSTKAVTRILIVQLVFFNSIVLLVVLSIVTDIPILKAPSVVMIEQLLGFLESYITAVVLELFGLVGSIVAFAFSHVK